MGSVLIVDDEPKITKLLSDRIAAEGFETAACGSAEEALERIAKGDVSIVLCDLRLGGMDGLELLRRTKRISPATDFVIMTAYASAETAVEAMRQGAYEYLIKPFQMDEVTLLLRRIQERHELISENLSLREKMVEASRGGGIVGVSPAIRTVRTLIAKVAPTDSPVLIEGESGTGKELVAAEVHSQSRRAGRAFVVLNCAAVPETLLESEMFGYEKGAFTGATQRKHGHFKLADKGTLFMDEIGEIPLPIQAKLLRAIELGEFTPLGSTAPARVDVRIIAATNRRLDELVRGGRFREDLFYRLNVFPIRIPPLRERREDIPVLAEHLLKRMNAPSAAIDAAVASKLERYGWPGNVRELKNILERAVILAGRDGVREEHVTIDAGGSSPAGGSGDALRALVREMTLPEIERRLILLALEEALGNKSRAAEMLGITRRTLYGRLERFGLIAPGEPSPEEGESGEPPANGD